MESQSVIEIDGSMMEGGGQILRNSITLACLMKHSIIVHSIRGKRSKPGLKAQHLKGLELICQISNGSMEGAELDSTRITFTPGVINGGPYSVDVKTAGSVCLLLQISLPCLCFANQPSVLSLKGGTNAEMAPPIDYHEMVFKNVAGRFGILWDCELIKRGFFPKGGGEVNLKMDPCTGVKATSLLEFGEVTKIYGLSYVAGMLNANVADRIAAAAKSLLGNITSSIEIKTIREDPKKAVGTGCGIIIVAETSTGCVLGSSAIGRKGKSHEDVGKEAAKQLLLELKNKACVDSQMQDQIILLMALANGTSKVLSGPLTLHTQTAIFVCEKLTKAKFTIQPVDESNNVIISCEGIGLNVN